ncbi:MAG: NADH-quinone oxidoreductase subunit M [bacterium]|nr:NADH-quinone oxidoreductase subunit M [bacterium]
MGLLSFVTWSPLIGAVLLALLPREPVRGVRRAALVFSLIPFVASLVMLARFQTGVADFQMVERLAWIPSWGIGYELGIDGISLFLVVLTTFLVPIVMLNAWGDVHKHVKEYFAFMLVLETGMIGALLALDLFLFYVFWEVMLVPMYFLIGLWGGEQRVYATMKFVLFTMAGSLLMLVAILYGAWQVKVATGAFGFSYEAFAALQLPLREQLLLFAAFGLAFAIKVPLFPLHTWLPDAHTQAPTGGSVILAGVMLKMGTYGFLRFAMPLFPAAVAEATPWIVWLSAIGIVYGALVATVQPDMKRLVAYSSVSHLGFVMLGMFALTPTAVAGSVYQMLNHGLSTGGLFLMVGMVYERRHTRKIADYGGLWAVVPRYAAVFLVVMFASAGLPGLNGFIGEFLVLVGTFPVHPWATAVATSGVILGALYLLWMYQRVIFGPVTHEENRKLTDLSPREVVVIAPVIAMCVFMGVYPRPFLERMQPSIDRVIARVQAASAAQAPPTVVADAAGETR